MWQDAQASKASGLPTQAASDGLGATGTCRQALTVSSQPGRWQCEGRTWAARVFRGSLEPGPLRLACLPCLRVQRLGGLAEAVCAFHGAGEAASVVAAILAHEQRVRKHELRKCNVGMPPRQRIPANLHRLRGSTRRLAPTRKGTHLIKARISSGTTAWRTAVL